MCLKLMWSHTEMVVGFMSCHFDFNKIIYPNSPSMAIGEIISYHSLLDLQVADLSGLLLHSRLQKKTEQFSVALKFGLIINRHALLFIRQMHFACYFNHNTVAAAQLLWNVTQT
ncbi:CLUMA_CG019831, isoform A [Clunio marinus]|uniref:CLUMA_CG019831, isoform A n=1 Tax=Clunio marinus TaxID=568069 RepID=A0A1J1J3E9_9DIPT|nr:CLUMA_CG019831, isoform A [Clunio marinus]